MIKYFIAISEKLERAENENKEKIGCKQVLLTITERHILLHRNCGQLKYDSSHDRYYFLLYNIIIF